MANAIEVVLPFDNLSDPELHDLDLVTFLFGYHDTTFMAVDRAKMDKALFDALKPGGLLVVAIIRRAPRMAPQSAKPCTASPRRRYETRLNARIRVCRRR